MPLQQHPAAAALQRLTNVRSHIGLRHKNIQQVYPTADRFVNDREYLFLPKALQMLTAQANFTDLHARAPQCPVFHCNPS